MHCVFFRCPSIHIQICTADVELDANMYHLLLEVYFNLAQVRYSIKDLLDIVLVGSISVRCSEMFGVVFFESHDQLGCGFGLSSVCRWIQLQLGKICRLRKLCPI